MILGGDEFLRTQCGNNNAYCQDNEISWFDWTQADRNQDMVEFVHKVIGLTRRFPVLQSRKFLLGADLDDNGVPDLTWFGTEGGPPSWNDPEARTLCYQLDAGEGRGEGSPKRLFFILHAHFEQKWVKLPPLPPGNGWFRILDTSLPSGEDFAAPGGEVRIDPGDHYIVNPRSTVVLFAQQPKAVRPARRTEPAAADGVRL